MRRVVLGLVRVRAHLSLPSRLADGPRQEQQNAVAGAKEGSFNMKMWVCVGAGGCGYRNYADRTVCFFLQK